jgi:hypothetical protein
MSFLAFAAYAISCVLAGLDINDGKGLVRPRGELLLKISRAYCLS